MIIASVFIFGLNKSKNVISPTNTATNGNSSTFSILFLTPSQVSNIYTQNYNASNVVNLSIGNYEDTYSRTYFGPSGSEIIITFDKFNTAANATQSYNSFVGNVQSVNYGDYSGLRYETASSQSGQDFILVLNGRFVLVIEFIKGAAVQNSEMALMQKEVTLAMQ